MPNYDYCRVVNIMEMKKKEIEVLELASKNGGSVAVYSSLGDIYNVALELEQNGYFKKLKTLDGTNDPEHGYLYGLTNKGKQAVKEHEMTPRSKETLEKRRNTLRLNADSKLRANSTIEYPEELTLDESDNYVWLYSGDDEAKAYKIAKKLHGQVYTQVDAENEDGRAYLRGYHLVNRTGWYICVGDKK